MARAPQPSAPALPLRYLIVGAGAIGGGLGGLLAAADVPVVLAARGEQLTAVRSDGLRIRTPDSTFEVHPPAVAGPGELRLGSRDVIVLTTKTQQAAAALAQWADAPVWDSDDDGGGGTIGTAGARLPVLIALNGVEAERLAARYFARVFGVCVWMPAVFLTPGEVLVRMSQTRGVFHVGRVPAALTTTADRDLAEQIRLDWGRADFDVQRREDVMAWKYRKLISNISNAFQALTATSADRDRLADLSEACVAEARAVLAAAGIAVTPDDEEARARAGFHIADVPGQHGQPGGSTWQSLVRGRPDVETDYLNGEIVALAHLHGLTAPRNARVASLLRQAAAAGWQPGQLGVEELRALLR